ncbi:PLP-dependent transferase [Streptomyces violaceorubidus]
MRNAVAVTAGCPPELGMGTVCAHYTTAVPAEAGPLVHSPSFSTAYHQDLDDVAPTRYGRWGHESADFLEGALGALDGGLSIVFNSGMSAISATLLSLVRSGEVLVVAHDTYYETRQIADQLRERGVCIRVLTDVVRQLPEAVDGARLVLLESPTNPLMSIHDLRECARLVHDAGALLAVDNSVSSPLGQRPLDLGADVVVTSDAKIVGGHNDLILGHVTVRDPELDSLLRDWRHLHGSIPSAFDCWLAQRSIGSLEMRVERQTANATALTEILARRDEVTDLRWPGWTGDPGYAIASRQMIRGGGLLAFRLPGREHLHRFLRASRLITPATSYGGLQSMANDIATWPHIKVPPGYVRISCGCETTADLVQDVLHALDTAL